jgi:two-component system LytT family response regulator
MSGPIRVLIVDDEQIAREGVRQLLQSEPDVEIVGECSDGTAALRALRRERVDICLLDIQMPGLNGFDVLRSIPEDDLPVVVVLTAYDQFALKAFDAHALDYVVKPFSDDRFRKAMARAREQVQQRRLGRLAFSAAQLTSLVEALARHSGEPSAIPDRARHLVRIAVPSVGKIAYVRVEDVRWIGAADYYAEIYTSDGRKHLVRETMQHLEDGLDPAAFVRIHRSAIVRIDQIAEIRSDGSERQLVVLRDGTRLPLGKARRAAVEDVLAKL